MHQILSQFWSGYNLATLTATSTGGLTTVGDIGETSSEAALRDGSMGALVLPPVMMLLLLLLGEDLQNSEHK